MHSRQSEAKVFKILNSLMKFLQLKAIPVLSFVMALALAGGSDRVALAQLAQTEPEEEELELIELGDRYGEDDSITETGTSSEGEIAGESTTDSEDEIFDGLIYDQEAQEYRLIEDPEEEDLVEPPSQRETDMAEIGRLFAVYKESIVTGNFLEADTLAKRIIELSIKVFGIDSTESAKALTNLAIAQHNNKEYEAAERNYLASIDIIERIEDRLNAALINPLKGLGATQLAIGRPDMARESFQRAVHITHVNDGPHNMGQIDVLESMAEIHLSVGEHKEALDIQEKMYSIQARKLEPTSLAILPALENQAHWQHRLQMYDRERVSWRRVIRVLEKHHGKADLRLIPPLTSLGKSYLFVTPAEYDMQPEISVASGETYLRRATRIADKNPDSDWQIQQQTLLALGDYYVLSGRPNRASRVYGELWTMLSNDEERLASRRQYLEELNILQEIFPPKYYRSEGIDGEIPDESEFEIGSVSYGYTVNSSGRATSLVHIETVPPQFKDMSDRVRRNLRHLVYRPRLAEGKMVATPDIIFVHEFYYRPQDIPVSPDESDKSSN